MRLALVVLLLSSAVMAEKIFAVELQDGQDANAVAAAHGFHNVGQIGSLHNMYRFIPLNAGPHAARTVGSRSIALRGDPSVIMVEEQAKRQQHRRGPVEEEAEM